MSNRSRWTLYVWALATGGALLLPGCLRDSVTEKYTYTMYTPVYTLKTTVLAGINGDAGTPIVEPGQLYIKGSYIYLNDVNKGIHVIDNSDPTHPVQTAFLNIPGNMNMAIHGNTLYADMYSDLLSIDITDPHQVKIIGKLFNFFTSRDYFQDSSEVITSWIVKDTTVVWAVPPKGVFYDVPGLSGAYTLDAGAVPAAASYAASSSGSVNGIAGSEASMTLVGDYLYAIPEPHSIGIVDITDSTQPTALTSIGSGYDLETIFPLQDKLFVGTKEGVYVYSIDNSSHQPIVEGEFKHGTCCDPVIADAQYAYVTLRSGTSCGGSSNELDVVSAQDLTQASLLKSYPMTGPTGLGKDGSLLFVCDVSVVKVFDASDPSNLAPLSQLPVPGAADVIASNGLLLAIGSGGLYEFDYQDPSHITLLSQLSVNQQ